MVELHLVSGQGRCRRALAARPAPILSVRRPHAMAKRAHRFIRNGGAKPSKSAPAARSSRKAKRGGIRS